MEVAHQQLMAVLMPHTAARKADERCKQQDGEAAVLHAAGSKAPSLWRRNGAPSVLVTASVAYGHSLEWHTVTASVAYGHSLHCVWSRPPLCNSHAGRGLAAPEEVPSVLVAC